jgi:predicted permease
LPGHPDLGDMSGAIWMAFGLVTLVLLIACFNVAALLMARTAERQKEISVRCAVGASRVRILRQLVTEGLLIAILAGGASLVLAAWSGSLLATFSLPAPIPQRLHLGVDWILVTFTSVMVLIAGGLPAIAPALQATRSNLLRSMRAESALGGRPSRTRNVLVVAQIAGSTMFVVGALLFVRSFLKSSAVEPGFDTARTAVLQIVPSQYGYDSPRSRELVEQLQARLESLPGVSHVGFADRVPFYVGITHGADCAADDCRLAGMYSISRGHFAALGIPLTAGRDFSAAEVTAGSAVIISQYMASQLWPGGEAVGRLLRIGEKGESATVVGVAADIKHRNMSQPADAYIYRPLRQEQYAAGVSVVVRTTGDPRQLLVPIREQLRGIAPDLPPSAIVTMTERMKMPLWLSRTTAGFFLVCGTVAMLLATVGLFGVMYFSVSQRTREFGIRAALGATRGRVLSLVLREGLRLAVPGVLLGTVGAYLGARLIAGALFGIRPADPLTFASTVAIELIVTLAACALPAWRATRVNPMVALRADA